jgi:uncharacterized protein YprB with RNaseH-like and TPR domain
MDTAMLDIEASNLDANFGVILSAAIKPYHRPIELFVNTEKWDDSQVVKQIANRINDFDVLVTFYGHKFDIPFFRARLLHADPSLVLKPTLHHIDLYYVARRALKLHSNSLETLTEFFNIKGKTRLKGEMWIRATAGDETGLKYVVEHNKWDVVILEKLYDVLKDYVGMIRTI